MRRILLACLLAVMLAPGALAADAPGDIHFEAPEGFPLEGGYFPHWVHRVRFTCNACHPALFPMARTAKMTMDDMREGNFCGACHNGRVGFAVTPQTCNRCHVPVGP